MQPCLRTSIPFKISMHAEVQFSVSDQESLDRLKITACNCWLQWREKYHFYHLAHHYFSALNYFSKRAKGLPKDHFLSLYVWSNPLFFFPPPEVTIYSGKIIREHLFFSLITHCYYPFLGKWSQIFCIFSCS